MIYLNISPTSFSLFYILYIYSISFCYQVKLEGKTSFLTPVCMNCLEGWTASIVCKFCFKPWTGGHLILGTMYSYDIFAAVPCCPERLKVILVILYIYFGYFYLFFSFHADFTFVCIRCIGVNAADPEVGGRPI